MGQYRVVGWLFMFTTALDYSISTNLEKENSTLTEVLVKPGMSEQQFDQQFGSLSWTLLTAMRCPMV